MTNSINIKFYREKKGFSQAELAEKCNLSQNHISQIEIGKKKPSLQALEQIAEALDVTKAELLNGLAESGEVKFSFVMDIREVESMEVRMNEFKLGTGDNDIFGLFRVPKDTDGVYVTMWKRLDGSS